LFLLHALDSCTQVSGGEEATVTTEGDSPTLDRKSTEDLDDIVARATAAAKAKNMRLRLMKARHENYLAERREERETDEEVTKELS
jgi:hypothetical protein